MTKPSNQQQDMLQIPVTLGALELRNRIIMSPMSRMRVGPDLAPGELVAQYYAQRASAGLVITESIMAAPYGDGYPNLPAIYSAEQQAGWRRVAAAVHTAGGLVVAQLATIGKPRFDESGQLPFGWAMGKPLHPHDLSTDDIADIVLSFAKSAKAAKDAGFDGIEIHNGNGFLLDRFLRTGPNLRTDEYGGSLENRTRLTLEIIAAACTIWAPGRVGIRLSPSALVDGAPDPSGLDTYTYLLRKLGELNLAYVHVTRVTDEDRAQGSGTGIDPSALRPHFSGKLIAAGAYTREDGERALAQGTLDAVVFGRLFIANPDLPQRFSLRAPLQAADPATFYTPDAHGYTDYPALAR